MIRNLIFISLFLIAQIESSHTVKLDLTVNNLKKVCGNIVVGIYNDYNNFPIDGKEFRKLSFKVSELSVLCSIHDLPPGEYALAIFHDENADGICNLGLFGIPKEGFGFSRNHRPRWHAPGFEDCKIEIRKNISLDIDLIFR
jgi:uncharacterized protein (DUF2141 family)